MAGSKVFVDLIIEDEVALNAIASGAQCTLSQMDEIRPTLQVGTMTLFGTWKYTSGTHMFVRPSDGSVAATASKCLSFSF